MQKETLFIHMRATFAKHVHAHMAKNEDIYVIVNDLGYKMWDNVRRDYPDRFINVGAAEQTLLGVAVGLALSNKIPIVYSITSFLLYRPFETIRNYINHEKIPVKLIGSGRDRDYMHDGISHWSEEDKALMNIFTNINAHWPEDVNEIPQLVSRMIKSNKPWYVNLKR
jgi:transketolase